MTMNRDAPVNKVVG